MMARAPSLDLVFNVGSRPVGSPCGFGVTRDGLFLGSGLCGGQCIGMGGEGFRENAVDLVGPASIMFDDLVRNFHHGEIPASAKGAAITLSRSGAVAPATNGCRRQRLPPPRASHAGWLDNAPEIEIEAEPCACRRGGLSVLPI